MLGQAAAEHQGLDKLRISVTEICYSLMLPHEQSRGAAAVGVWGDCGGGERSFGDGMGLGRCVA